MVLLVFKSQNHQYVFEINKDYYLYDLYLPWKTPDFYISLVFDFALFSTMSNLKSYLKKDIVFTNNELIIETIQILV